MYQRCHNTYCRSGNSYCRSDNSYCRSDNSYCRWQLVLVLFGAFPQAQFVPGKVLGGILVFVALDDTQLVFVALDDTQLAVGVVDKVLVSPGGSLDL